MTLSTLLKRLSLQPLTQQLRRAEAELPASHLPQRLVRRHSAFLYYSSRHYAATRRSAS